MKDPRFEEVKQMFGALLSTSVSYERKFAWGAPYLGADDERGFIDELLDGQPNTHAYFARMKRQNTQGPALLGELPALRMVTADELTRGMQDGLLALVNTRAVVLADSAGDSTMLLLDVRNRSEHAQGTVPGAVQLSAGKVFFHHEDLPPRDAGQVITFCQSGLRNSVAAAALHRAGYDIVELDGSYAAWSHWSAAQDEPTSAPEHV